MKRAGPQKEKISGKIYSEIRDLLLKWEGLCIRLQEGDPTALSEISRVAHSLKGTSASFGLLEFSALVHQVEDLFEYVKGADRSFHNEELDVVSRVQEILLDWLESAKADRPRSLAPEQCAATISRLAGARLRSGDEIQVGLMEFDDDVLSEFLASKGNGVEASDPRSASKTFPAAVLQGAASVDSKQSEVLADTGPRNEEAFEEMLRVSTAKIDLIIKTVQNMTVFQNIIFNAIRTGNIQAAIVHDALEINTKSLKLLQEASVGLRMVPVREMFQGLKRVAYDVGRRTGKKIKVSLVGQDVEIDKTVVDEVQAALAHIVRNCVDHGVEVPAFREAAGKAPEGNLILAASKKLESVRIVISDDGQGLAYEKILSKAREKGVPLPSSHPTEEEIAELIFAQGLSTAEGVTDISGRGVGMDVVRTTFEKIGGSVKIASERGRGTEFSIGIPTNLNILEVLVTEVGGVDYAFPAHFVERVVDIKEFDSLSYGERGNGFHMDGGFVPLFDGTEFLRRSSAPSGAQERESAALFPNTQPPSAEALAGSSDHHARLRKRSAVVVEWAGQAFGFVVDRVKGRQRVHSVKLNGLVQGEGIYSGMTIFHDGRPGLVVDVHALARQAGAANRGVA